MFLTPPPSRRGRISRTLLASLAAAVIVVAAASLFLRSAGLWPRTPESADEPAEIGVSLSGPAFSSGATVADLKQAAMETAQELATSFPESPDAWHVLAQLQFHLGNTPEATKLWERCLAARPKFGEALYGLGYIAYLEGESALAAERFQAALAAQPDDMRIPLLLAECLTRIGKPEAAVPLLQACLQSDPDSLEALVALGQIYLDLQQYEKSRQIFERAARLDPESREACFGLGTAWARLGEAEKAKREMGRFKGLAADWRRVSTARVLGFDDVAKGREVALLIHNEAAKTYLAQNNLKKAEETWLKAAAIDATSVPCRLELVALYERTHRDRAALRICEQLRDIDPRNADYWLNIGVLNGRLGRYETALAAVDRAIQLDPANAGYRQAREVIRRSR